MDADILVLKKTHFVLWRGKASEPPPRLVIGKLQPGAPVTLVDEQQFDLHPRSADTPDLWVIAAADCNITNGEVYHYWFEVTDAHPDRTGQRIRVSDPMAYTIDWRLRAPRPAGSEYNDDDRYPASVVKFDQGRLIPSDVGGETGELENEPPLSSLPKNNRLVL